MALNSFFIVIYTFFFCISCNGQQVDMKNIALHSKYKLSEVPNYSATKGTDDKDLTDGSKKKGLRFWQDKSTVGWRGVSEIDIDIDLGKINLVSGFSINTARNSAAEVECPLNCFVFTSTDNKNFSYRGNLMENVDNTSGNYKVKSFSLYTEPIEAQYVKFVLQAKSKFIFLDELEVYGVISEGTVSQKETKTIDKNELKDYLKNIQSKLQENLNSNREINSLREYLSIDESDRNYSLDELKVLNKESQLKRLPKGIVFTVLNDISIINKFKLEDVINSSDEPINEEIDNYNGSLFFLLTNNQEKSVSVDFESTDYKLFEVLKVANLKNVSLYDALKPLNEGKIKIEAGEQKIFLLSYDRFIAHKSFTISSSNKIIKRLQFSSNFINKNEIKERLNANVWSYMDKPVIKEHKKYVINDLETTGINTIVINSVFIDNYQTKDFPKLKTYLKDFDNLADKQILLFYNLKNKAAQKFGGKKFLDNDFKTNFSSWYKILQRELQSIGIRKENIYFYPYDEIVKSEVANFVDLNSWAKKEIKYYQSFVTIINQETFEAANSADLLQISKHMLPYLSNIKNKNLWFYDVLDGSRERDPIKDYRLLSWIAYYYDLKGVGFWNYSALKNAQSAKYTIPIDNNEDYSVVYLDEKENILSSVRWLYFTKGLEDYQILKSAERRIGKDKVNALIRKVINNPTETETNKALEDLYKLNLK